MFRALDMFSPYIKTNFIPFPISTMMSQASAVKIILSSEITQVFNTCYCVWFSRPIIIAVRLEYH